MGARLSNHTVIMVIWTHCTMWDDIPQCGTGRAYHNVKCNTTMRNRVPFLNVDAPIWVLSVGGSVAPCQTPSLANFPVIFYFFENTGKNLGFTL